MPKTITAGFQKRYGTYTGQLAYIIYTDEKGVLRKEKSWNSWRDEEIEPLTFDNVPTSGFVLKKQEVIQLDGIIDKLMLGYMTQEG